MRPSLCPLLETVTTRASARPSIASISRAVRAKWPRWLVPSCSSKPSLVPRRGAAITPALLTSRSSPDRSPLARKLSAKEATEERSARSRPASSTRAPGTCASSSCLASAPLARFRQAITTVAPWRASSRAAARPRPLLAPVTIAVRPVWSGICPLLHSSLIAVLPSIGSGYDQHLAVRAALQQRPRLRHALERNALGLDRQLSCRRGRRHALVGGSLDLRRRGEVGVPQ